MREQLGEWGSNKHRNGQLQGAEEGVPGSLASQGVRW